MSEAGVEVSLYVFDITQIGLPQYEMKAELLNDILGFGDVTTR
jgi:hypothetical protein